MKTARPGPPHRSRTRPLADLVAALVDPVLARKAGMTTALVAAWPEICGERLAAVSRPDKLSWPPRRSDLDPFEPAVLVVACEGASALRLQHQTGQIIERLNAFFGYAAVGRLRIVQQPVHREVPSRKPVLSPVGPEAIAQIAKMTAAIEDTRLRAALEGLGRAVRARAGETDRLQEAERRPVGKDTIAK